MLVLSRGRNEKVILAGLGEVMVSEIKSNGKARLSFEFPDEVHIHRQEVFEVIVEELKAQIPDDCDKDAIVNYLFAEVAFRSAEKQLHAASDAAKQAVINSGNLELSYNGETWAIESAPYGPVAFTV